MLCRTCREIPMEFRFDRKPCANSRWILKDVLSSFFLGEGKGGGKGIPVNLDSNRY